MNPKYTRYLFWPLWFVLVPLALAWLSVRILSPGDATSPSGILSQIRWLVQDQPVPAIIILFTIYDTILYRYRYELPFAADAVGGRVDLPHELRREYEQAGQLLDESERILRRHARSVERELPSGVRDEVRDALDDLRQAMQSETFVAHDFESALDRASGLVSRHLGRWQKSELREYVESIGVAIGVALLLRACVVEAYKIPSGSMLPSLQLQDHIFVNKLAYGVEVPFTKTRLFTSLPPRRGDVMVFEYPDPVPENERQDFIKRVIAVPGDTLEAENGHPIINGWKVPSCRVGPYTFEENAGNVKHGDLYVEYLGDATYLTVYEDDRMEDPHQGPYHVKPGEAWVFGDNRNNSLDSRAWLNGKGAGVPFANIKGRAMFVWLSRSAGGAITWDRLFHDVMGKPVLPKGAPDSLVAAIADCVAKRPAQTLPPEPSGD